MTYLDVAVRVQTVSGRTHDAEFPMFIGLGRRMPGYDFMLFQRAACTSGSEVANRRSQAARAAPETAAVSWRAMAT